MSRANEIWKGRISLDSDAFIRVSLQLSDYDFFERSGSFVWWSKDRFIKVILRRTGRFEIMKGDTFNNLKEAQEHEVGDVELNTFINLIKPPIGKVSTSTKNTNFSKVIYI